MLLRCSIVLFVCISQLSSLVHHVQYNNLKEFDEVIQQIENTPEVARTFGGLISLAILFYVRDDQWMQGGAWKALYYTIKAAEFMENRYDLSSDRNLRFSLTMHRNRILFSLGRYTEVIESLDSFYLQQKRLLKSAAHDFRLAQILFMHGEAHLSSGNYSAARESFMGSIKHSPCFHQAYFKLAQSLSMNSADSSEILNFLRESTERIIGRIFLEKKTNRIIYREGQVIICEAVDNEANTLDDLYRFSTISSGKVKSEIELNAVNKQQQLRLVLSTFHWTLFHIFEIQKDYQRAWYHMQQMRYLERFRLLGSAVYNLSSNVESARYALTQFGPDYWPKTKAQWIGLADKTPVFIVGFFRSGSTLLESLLDTHSNVWGMGENSLLTYQLLEMQNDLTALSGLDGTPQMWTEQLSKVLQRHATAIVTGMRAKYREHLLGLSLFNDTSLENLYRWQENVNESSPRIDRIVDKMLLNYRNIPLIHLLFPEAIILHTVRDPLDTLLSCMKNRFGDFSVYSLEFRTLVYEYVVYLEVIDHYRRILPSFPYKTGRRKALVDVRYEEIVANPKKMVRRLLGLLELPSSFEIREVEGFYEQRRHVKTASFLQVKQPIYERSVGNWKNYERQLEQTLIPELAHALQKLKISGSLPFLNDRPGAPRMNWNLDPNFNYTDMIEKLR